MRLTLPDWTKQFIVKSDWSQEGMGAALLQKGDDGKLKPIAFAGRKCTKAEAAVGAPDGELLALVWAIKRFEKFLSGSRFQMYVDQGSLEWLKDRRLSSINNKRMQTSFAYLRQFHFDLNYLSHKKMQDVDALSRMGGWSEDDNGEKEATTPAAAAEVEEGNGGTTWLVDVDLPNADTVVAGATAKLLADDLGVAQVELEELWGFDTLLKDIGEVQKNDAEVIAIREMAKGKTLAEIETVPMVRDAIAKHMSIDPKMENFVDGQDGRLYHLEMQNGVMKRLLYVPLEMRGRLVVAKHAAAVSGHREAGETLAKLRKHYFWMSMNRDVRAWLEQCGCQRKKAERRQRVGETQSLKIMRPGEKVVFDIFGPLPASLEGNVYLLVMVDVGTREIMLKALKTRAAVGIARAIFRRVYLRGMCPSIFQSDLAKEFVAEIMKELFGILGAEFKHSSPYHPQTNTHVERYNRTIATQLSLLIRRSDQRDWDQYLKHVEYAQLVGAQAVLGRLSPMFLKGGWEALDPTDVAMGPEAVQTKSKDLREWLEDLQRARQLAMTSQESSVSRDAKRLDLKAKCLDVDVGDKVWVMFPNVGTGRSRKLAFRMHGTYVIREWLHGAKRVAVVGHQDDENDVMLVHVDRMVRKKELSQKLQKEWKPIKLNLVHQNMAKRQEKADAANAKKQSVAEDDKLKRVLAEVDPEVAKEIEKELDDEDYRIEHILSHRMRQGKREFKVKFVGYGPDHNLWYWEKDLRETTPEMVDEYLAEKGEQTQKAPKSRAVAQPKKSKAKRANKLKTGV
jgi:transposase InsO family protein